MKDTITWGMIGCGNVTEIKNGPGLYLARDSRLKGVYNRTREKAESWVMRHGHGQVYDTADALILDPEIDVIYIATTPDTHADLAIRCARAGKHVLVEKPAASSYEEGLRMRDAFREADRKCWVAFYRRAMDRFTRLCAILNSGEIGDLTGIQLLHALPPADKKNWRADPKVCGGDLFTETDIHALDILQLLSGNMDRCRVFRRTAPTAYSLSGISGRGVALSGLFVQDAPEEKDRFILLGTMGSVETAFFRNDAPFCVRGIHGYREETVADSPHVGLNMEQSIVDELLGRGHFSGTLEEALPTLFLTSGAYAGGECQ